MGKNMGKGGKSRRKGQASTLDGGSRELIFKEDLQEYAKVTKMLGDGRLLAFCYDGKTRICHIRGKMRKKVWINVDDHILVTLRDYQDEKADVIHRYNDQEVRQLRLLEELPERMAGMPMASGEQKEEEAGFEFAEVDINEI